MHILLLISIESTNQSINQSMDCSKRRFQVTQSTNQWIKLLEVFCGCWFCFLVQMCGDCWLIGWFLQNEDEEGYRKLIDQKKDRRLAYLLKQTDEYVESLTEVRFLHSECIADFLRLGCFVFFQMVRDHKTSVRKKMQQEQKERRMQEEAQKYAIVESEENSQDSMNEENSQSSEQEQTIHVVEVSTRKILKGDDAPKASELDSWLEQHPVFFGKCLFSHRMAPSISRRKVHIFSIDWLIDFLTE